MSANVARQWLDAGRAGTGACRCIAGGQQQFNYDGTRTDAQQQAYYGLEFPNYWILRTLRDPQEHDGRRSPDARRSRGESPGWNFGHFQVSTDPRQRAVFDVTLEGSRGVDGTASYDFAPGVAFKPASNIFVAALADVQLVAERAAVRRRRSRIRRRRRSAATATCSATSRRAQLSLETRVNWTIRPTVTLQLYAQPFFASGDYSAFREFAAPRTREAARLREGHRHVTRDASTGELHGRSRRRERRRRRRSPSATRTSRPLAARHGGAALGVSSRLDDVLRLDAAALGRTQFGDLDFRRDYRSLFGDRPDNVFLVKATYWVGR